MQDFPGDVTDCVTENGIAEVVNVHGRTYGTVSPEPLSAVTLGLFLSKTSSTQPDNMQERGRITGVFRGKKKRSFCAFCTLVGETGLTEGQFLFLYVKHSCLLSALMLLPLVPSGAP